MTLKQFEYHSPEFLGIGIGGTALSVMIARWIGLSNGNGWPVAVAALIGGLAGISLVGYRIKRDKK